MKLKTSTKIQQIHDNWTYDEFFKNVKKKTGRKPSKEYRHFLGCPNTDCWYLTNKNGELTKSRTKSKNGEVIRTVQIAFYLHNAYETREYVLIRHRCNNPHCVNPDHLVGGNELLNRLDTMFDRNNPNRMRLVQVIDDTNKVELNTVEHFIRKGYASSEQIHKGCKTGIPIANRRYRYIDADVGNKQVESLVKQLYQDAYTNGPSLYKNDNDQRIVAQIEDDTNKIVAVFSSVRNAANAIRVNPAIIRSALRRRPHGNDTKTINGIVRGYRWDEVNNLLVINRLILES